MMTGMHRTRRWAVVGALVGLLAGAVGDAENAGHLLESSDQSVAAVEAPPPLGSLTAGTLGSRLPRLVELRERQRVPVHQSLPRTGEHRRDPQSWVLALATVLERAGHPERLGEILLRGPPGPSA